MSSEAPSRTVVPAGITDPVARARAELRAALAAIEEKANVPKRVGRAGSAAAARARVFARRKPFQAALMVVGVSAAVGGAVWGIVRLYTR